MKKKGLLIVALLACFSTSAWAFQDEQGVGMEEEYKAILKEATEARKTKLANLSSYGRQSDSASVRPIREADVMFKVRLWTRINFNEKINRSFSSSRSKLINYIYEGVEQYFELCNGCEGDALKILLDSGSFIVPYMAQEGNEQGYEKSLFYEKSPITRENFDSFLEDVNFTGENATEARLNIYEAQLAAEDPNFNQLDPVTRRERARQAFDNDQAKRKTQSLLRPENGIEFDQIMIEEDLIFDKNHSVPTWDIISLTVLSPSSGATKSLFKVQFADLKRYIDKRFKESRNTEAFWFNSLNPGNTNLSFSDAFDKRLFNSYIISVENVDNKDITSGFVKGDGYNSLVYAEKIRMQLLERIHNLWEY